MSWISGRAWGAIGLFLLAAASAATCRGDDRPNVLVILSDDHSAPHLGCYGNPDVKTPNLDRLAAEGKRFDRAYVACPQCVPSRAAIMTGRSPVAIDMTRFTAPLGREIPIFPEILKKTGYFSGVAGRTYHLDGARNSPASQAVFDEHKLATFADRLDYVKVGNTMEQSVAQFVEFLDAVPEGKPFCLQLCFNDPHRPLNTKPAQPLDPAKITLPAHFPDTPLVRETFAAYLDEIAHVDIGIGQVLDELKKRDLSGRTIVVFMGDNGCSQLRGKGTLNEFGVHVPLLVRWPGIVAAASEAKELISGEDIAPTLLDVAGVEIPKEMTGRSFLPLLKGGDYEPRKYVFAERGAHGGALPTNSANFDLGRAIIGPRYKLIYTATWQIPYIPVDCLNEPFWKDLAERHQKGELPAPFDKLYFAPTRPMFELYDLEKDPAELTNLAGQPEVAEVEKELKFKLQEWMILQRDFLPLPVPPAQGQRQRRGQRQGNGARRRANQPRQQPASTPAAEQAPAGENTPAPVEKPEA
ncbi:MAG TPA: sulfatase [Pirellulales bacterium]